MQNPAPHHLLVEGGLMTVAHKKWVSDFYEKSYKELGLGAQRRYPNEELCRFMGKNLFKVPQKERKTIKVLETGCGSGANLRMVAQEGFDAYGIDLSEEAIGLCRQMLASSGLKAHLQTQDMQDLAFEDHFFDVVIDVFSSYCLTRQQWGAYMRSVHRVLKPGGLFFSYFPSKRSDCFQFPGEAQMIDQDTLEGIHRQDAPFSGNTYPFRFMHPREYEKALLDMSFDVPYLEEVGRTYGRGKECFAFVVVEGVKRAP